MSRTKKMTPNEAYRHLSKNEMVEGQRLYAQLVERTSPGSGFHASIQLRYRDMTHPRLEHLSSPAYAAVFVLPQSCRSEYDRVVNKAIAAQKDQSATSMKKAELEATLTLFKDPRAQVIFADKEVLQTPVLLTELANRNDLDGGDFDVVRNRIMHDGAVSVDNIVDPDLKVLAESLLEEMSRPVSVADSPALHPSWRNHFNTMARRERNMASAADISL